MCGGPVAWRFGTCLPRRGPGKRVPGAKRGTRVSSSNFWAVTRRLLLPEVGGERTPQAATQATNGSDRVQFVRSYAVMWITVALLD